MPLEIDRKIPPCHAEGACAGHTTTREVNAITNMLQGLIALLIATLGLILAAQKWLRAAEQASKFLR